MDNEISFNEAMIEEREQGIRDIQEEIGQANEIFKDLAVLVHEQGVVIGKTATLNINYSCCNPQSFPFLFLAKKTSNLFCYDRRHSLKHRLFLCCNNSRSSSAS